MLDHMARFFTETALLSEIGDSRIAEYVSTRRGETYRGKAVSNATVNRDVELLRRVYRRADRVWKRDVGTMPDWQAHSLPEAAGRIRALSQPEIQALLTATALKLPDLLPALRFSMTTGLRLTNVLTLKWGQVDLAGKRLTFKVKSKQPGGENLQIPITAPALVEIANQKGLHATYVFTYGCIKKRGARLRGARLPFTKTGWRARWKKILAAAKIEDFRWHDLRHTAATWTLRETRNLALVKRMLGHADIKSTERYAHVLDEDLALGMEAAARRILDDPTNETDVRKLERSK
jgi:integrase